MEGDTAMHVKNVTLVNAVKSGVLLLMILVLSNCAGIHESEDYTRHRYSRLSEPYDRNDVMYFDATFTPEFPDNEAGEAKRMEWLRSWLDQRNICAEGFEVVTRRPFDAMESNPAQHDIRYEVSCGTG